MLHENPATYKARLAHAHSLVEVGGWYEGILPADDRIPPGREAVTQVVRASVRMVVIWALTGEATVMFARHPSHGEPREDPGVDYVLPLSTWREPIDYNGETRPRFVQIS